MNSAQAAAGWYPDPNRRFAQRYWDGSAWTSNVADAGGAQSQDPMQAAGDGSPTLEDRLRQAEIDYEALLVEAKTTGMHPATLARRALEVGLVVHDGAAWLFVLPAETWYRYDGVRLQPRRGSITASESLRTQE